MNGNGMTVHEQSEVYRVDAEMVASVMTEVEAKECTVRIKQHLSDARYLIQELHDRQGWKALGYATWNACIEAEFDQKRRQVFSLLAAAKVEKNLQNQDQSAETAPANSSIPTSHLMPLTGLTPAQQRKAFDEADKTARQQNRARRAVVLATVDAAMVNRGKFPLSPTTGNTRIMNKKPLPLNPFRKQYEPKPMFSKQDYAFEMAARAYARAAWLHWGIRLSCRQEKAKGVEV